MAAFLRTSKYFVVFPIFYSFSAHIHSEATMSVSNGFIDEKSSDRNVGAEKGEPSANGSSDAETGSMERGSSGVDGSQDPPQVQDISPEIPNGGLQSWLQVAGSFFLVFNTWYVIQRRCNGFFNFY